VQPTLRAAFRWRFQRKAALYRRQGWPIFWFVTYAPAGQELGDRPSSHWRSPGQAD
jgi:hypothetical protein